MADFEDAEEDREAARFGLQVFLLVNPKAPAPEKEAPLVVGVLETMNLNQGVILGAAGGQQVADNSMAEGRR